MGLVAVDGRVKTFEYYLQHIDSSSGLNWSIPRAEAETKTSLDIIINDLQESL